MTALTPRQRQLITGRLRKHLTLMQLSLSQMTTAEYTKKNTLLYDSLDGPITGLQVKLNTQKEVDDTLEALSLL